MDDGAGAGILLVPALRSVRARSIVPRATERDLGLSNRATSTPASMRFVFVALLVLAAACAGSDAGDGPDSSGLETIRDSSRTDSVIVRVAGAVAADRLRSVTEELRIQPDAEDTTLFGETYDFEVGLDGRLFVYDASAQRILLFGPDGAYRRGIGRQGAGPGEFNQGNGMVILPDGRLAVLDARNARISFFSADGEFINSWITPSGFSTTNGLRSDRSGRLYLVRPVTAPREGEILGRMGLVPLSDSGKFVDSLVAPDLPIERVTYVAQVKGNTSSTGPRHAARFLWSWHPDGYFVSAAGGTYAIEVSRPGSGLRIVRDAPEVPVPDEERAWDQERITFNLRMTDPGWTWNGPAIPAVKPPVRDLHVARDGRIWVRVSTPSEPIPEAEREPRREGRAEPARFRDAVHYEVFAAEGRFLGRVVLPVNSTWIEAEGDRVWVLDRDADGLPGVVRLRVSPGF